MRYRLLGWIVAAGLLVLGGCSEDTVTTQDQLDRRFEEMMDNVTLVGRSTRVNSDRVFGEERYVIEGVSKVSGNTWLFQARMQYGGADVPLPLPVTIEWAGETPVITLTDMPVPGKGSFSARVVLYDGQYAGTWSGEGEGHAGQIFGKIVPNR